MQVGFATYVPRELWQGVDVFSDPYRCNMTDLLSGLETVSRAPGCPLCVAQTAAHSSDRPPGTMHNTQPPPGMQRKAVGARVLLAWHCRSQVCCTLVDAGLALEALPVLALWEHVAWLVTRNLQATVLCRCALGQEMRGTHTLQVLSSGQPPVVDMNSSHVCCGRVRRIVRAHALVQLGLLREAAGLLVDLMQGSRLPDPTLDSDLVVKDEQGAPLQVRGRRT